MKPGARASDRGLEGQRHISRLHGICGAGAADIGSGAQKPKAHRDALSHSSSAADHIVLCAAGAGLRRCTVDERANGVPLPGIGVRDSTQHVCDTTWEVCRGRRAALTCLVCAACPVRANTCGHTQLARPCAAAHRSQVCERRLHGAREPALGPTNATANDAAAPRCCTLLGAAAAVCAAACPPRGSGTAARPHM